MRGPIGLRQDTLTDKIARFVLGCLMGAGAGWLITNYGAGSTTDAGHVETILIAAGVVGLLGVLLGNAFLEKVIKHGPW